MVVSSRLLFPASVVLLAHAIFVCVWMRDELQAHHHGVGGAVLSPSLPSSASHIPYFENLSVLPISVVLEVVIGLALAIAGCVSSNNLSKVRQQDYLATQSYDQSLFSGYEFAHFNHRGFTADVAAPDKKLK
jgi:hypothetical protein